MDHDALYRLIAVPERLPGADDDVHDAFWRAYPRFRFFKTLAVGARLLDIGAGSGGLAYWRDWLHPMRPDLRLFGVDFSRGEHAGMYEGWWTGNLDAGLPDFGEQRFEGFLASHLIEHLASLPKLVRYLAGVAAPGARLYFEWPAPHTQALPPASELARRGFQVQTFNFMDDGTHQHTYALDEAAGIVQAEGFTVVERGETRLGALAEELLARGRRRDDLTWRQMGLWAAVGWSNYLVAEAPRATG